jgi:signal transduction histidine kinase
VSLILQVPTINDQLEDFDRLFELWGQVKSDCLDVTFDFTHCKFLRQNAVAFLGGMARLIESRQGKVTFDWDTLQANVCTNLKQNGFMSAFSQGFSAWQGNSIPYKEDKVQDRGSIMEYLMQKWLGRGWVQVSPLAQSEIVGKVWEIYANSFEHSHSPVGVFSCGQRYPAWKQLKLTTVDFGVGIPENVRSFLNQPDRSAIDALKWAFQPGKTTNRKGISRGLGLDILKDFVRCKQGRLEIFSNNGYALICGSDKEVYEERRVFFGGTLVNITIQCNAAYYCLDFETEDELFF